MQTMAPRESLVTTTEPGTIPSCTLHSAQPSWHSTYPAHMSILVKMSLQFCGVNGTWFDLIWGISKGTSMVTSTLEPPRKLNILDNTHTVNGSERAV